MTGWFHQTQVAPGVFCTTEPHVHDFYRANAWTVIGRDADLQVDFGVGLCALRPALPLGGKTEIAVATHAHVDHIGGFHEFDRRLGHAAEAEGFASISEAATLKHWFRDQTWGDSLTALPNPGFRLADWDLRPAPLTATLAEGDRIDLGDRRLTVLQLPGHSPGGIGLLDEADGTFLAGDAVYEGGLLDDIPGASVPDYLATMARLMRLDCRIVLAGHGLPFDKARMVGIAGGYIRSKEA